MGRCGAELPPVRVLRQGALERHLNRAWARSGMMGAVWYPDDDASPFEVSTTPVALANRIIPAQPHQRRHRDLGR